MNHSRSVHRKKIIIFLNFTYALAMAVGGVAVIAGREAFDCGAIGRISGLDR